MFLPDCLELQAQGGLCFLVRMDASSLPIGRSDRKGCGSLLGRGCRAGCVELTCLWKEREGRNEKESCQEDLVKTQTWNPVGKEEAGL